MSPLLAFALLALHNAGHRCPDPKLLGTDDYSIHVACRHETWWVYDWSDRVMVKGEGR